MPVKRVIAIIVILYAWASAPAAPPARIVLSKDGWFRTAKGELFVPLGGFHANVLPLSRLHLTPEERAKVAYVWSGQRTDNEGHVDLWDSSDALLDRWFKMLAEGVARYGHRRGLLPRLGFFAGAEERIPYDFDELLALIAPRPVLVMAPQLDRDATFADVRAAMEQARAVYRLHHAGDRLELYAPWDYNRLPETHQQHILDWMRVTLK